MLQRNKSSVMGAVIDDCFKVCFHIVSTFRVLLDKTSSSVTIMAVLHSGEPRPVTGSVYAALLTVSLPRLSSVLCPVLLGCVFLSSHH